MPLIPTQKRASRKQRETILRENIATERRAGKPAPQAAAIAYAEERRTSGSEGSGQREVHIGDTCSLDDDRACKLSTGIAFAQDISREAKIALPESMQTVIASGNASESAVKAALDDWLYTLPRKYRAEGRDIIRLATTS